VHRKLGGGKRKSLIADFIKKRRNCAKPSGKEKKGARSSRFKGKGAKSVGRRKTKSGSDQRRCLLFGGEGVRLLHRSKKPVPKEEKKGLGHQY